MFNSKTDSSHQNYNDGLTNTKKLILMSEFILDMSLEDEYAQYLQNLLDKKEWFDFQQEIKETICEYGITLDEIEANISSLIKVKPMSFC
ncbi:hypothetical protein ABC255_08615 [Neobacillus sp. 3P2-tot-E-2]|uniref:hypothetical protein n=1 Tax=Neobacillus sp. 3P2-tot-E-2 TaxID=3132212 RepID=UPI00399F6E25